MSFSFGFRNEDIEESADEVEGKVPELNTLWPSEAAPPKHHDLKSLVRSLHPFVRRSTPVLAAPITIQES